MLELLQQFCEYMLAVINHGVQEPLAVLIFAIMGVIAGKSTKFALLGARRLITTDQGNRLVQLLSEKGRATDDHEVTAVRDGGTAFKINVRPTYGPKLSIQSDTASGKVYEEVSSLFTRMDKYRIRKAANRILAAREDQKRRDLLAKI
jgi:hypothetical protein